MKKKAQPVDRKPADKVPEVPAVPAVVSVWATFKLREYVELDKAHTQVEREIKNNFGAHIESFIPVHRHKVSSHERLIMLFDGYVFVRHDGSVDFLNKANGLRGTYIEGALKNNGKVYTTLGTEIDRYRALLEEQKYPFQPAMGDYVHITEGTFKSMNGKVVLINMIENSADVVFRTRTREVTAKNLSFCAMVLIEDPFS